MVSYYPIALFVYNRLAHTQKLVESLRKSPEAADSDLFVFSDAARSLEQESSVAAVRDYLYQIQGFKNLHIIAHPQNQGLAASITQGVSALCQTHGAVIVLEDDLVLSPYFLAYMNNALYRYQKAENIMQIAGYSFNAHFPSNPDAFFLPMISSWGWATWQRAWRHYDHSAASFSVLQKNFCQRWAFDLGGTSEFYKMLQYQQKGKNQSWAIRWYLSVFMKQGLTLFPRKTLVQNNGFDGSGQHCHNQTFEQPMDMHFRVQDWPLTEMLCQDAYQAVRTYYQKQRKPHRALKHWAELCWGG